jgi:hypothetical protein
MARMSRLALGGALATIALVAAAPVAFAAEPCVEEIEQFCPDVPVGEGNIVRCLHEHREQLSPGCVERMRADAKKLLQVSADCLDDVDRFCNDVEPGKGRVIVCLSRHEQDLAPVCRKHLQEGRRNVRKKLAGACDDDIETLCKGVRPGRGRIQRCLEQHKDELSAGCVEKLKADKERRAQRAEQRKD